MKSNINELSDVYMENEMIKSLQWLIFAHFS